MVRSGRLVEIRQVLCEELFCLMRHVEGVSVRVNAGRVFGGGICVKNAC
jgi:hypothetical protein